MSEWMSGAVRYGHRGFGLMKVGGDTSAEFGGAGSWVHEFHLVGLGFWHHLAGWVEIRC